MPPTKRKTSSSGSNDNITKKKHAKARGSNAKNRERDHQAERKEEAVAAASAAGDLPFDQWRVTLSGDFVGKAGFEQTLKSRGVTVTGSVSSKTTHLLLGKSGRNEYGHQSGVGSKKHRDAEERGLPILTQPQVMRLLAGQNMEQVTEKPKAPPKSANMYDKVLHCVATSNDEQKISLTKLKAELQRRYGIDCGKGATKASLKKALEKATAEGRLERSGGSYRVPLAAVAMEEAPEETLEAKVHRMAPARGHWRGLRVTSSKTSKSGRAMCVFCEETIAKGRVQVEVVDDSIFKMLTRKGGIYQDPPRPYVECEYPGFSTVGTQKFFLHEACQEGANEEYQQKFREDWARIQPHVENDARLYALYR